MFSISGHDRHAHEGQAGIRWGRWPEEGHEPPGHRGNGDGLEGTCTVYSSSCSKAPTHWGPRAGLLIFLEKLEIPIVIYTFLILKC